MAQGSQTSFARSHIRRCCWNRCTFMSATRPGCWKSGSASMTCSQHRLKFSLRIHRSSSGSMPCQQNAIAPMPSPSIPSQAKSVLGMECVAAGRHRERNCAPVMIAATGLPATLPGGQSIPALHWRKVTKFQTRFLKRALHRHLHRGPQAPCALRVTGSLLFTLD